MTQLAVDYGAVSNFNNAAPVLESITIGRRKFEMIHDYWHNHHQCGGRPSVIVREPTRTNPWFGMDLWPVASGFHESNCPFRKGSKNFVIYQTWVTAARSRHMP